MREELREDLTLYESFADADLYEKVMTSEIAIAARAARGIYVSLSMLCELPEEVTPEYLASLDGALQEKGTSMSKIVAKELQRALRSAEEFLATRDTEAFQREYQDYSEHWDTAVVD